MLVPDSHAHLPEMASNCKDAARAHLGLMLTAHARAEVPHGHLRSWLAVHTTRDATYTPGLVADSACLAILAWHHGTGLQAQDVCHGIGLNVAEGILALQHRGRPEAPLVRKTGLCAEGVLLQIPASRSGGPKDGGPPVLHGR